MKRVMRLARLARPALPLAFCLLAAAPPGFGSARASGLSAPADPIRSEGDVVPIRKLLGKGIAARSSLLETAGDTIWTYRDSLETLSSPSQEGGWTHYDASAQPSAWHIDTTYACQGHAFWCGLVDSSWVNDPNRMGYDNGWEQFLQNSVDLSSAASPATLSFKYQMDVESGYDYGAVDVLDLDFDWTQIAFLTGVHHGSGGAPCDTFTVTIPDTIIAKSSTVFFRFRFHSDVQGSSADGLYQGDGWSIDNVTVKAALNDLRFFDDFESGPGTWAWTVLAPAGDYWAVRSGVPTEQVCTTNSSKVWDPVSQISGALVPFMDDRLISPPISIARPDQALLAFDVYRSLPANACFYYNLSYRTRNVGDPTWSPWLDPSGLLYFGNEKEWLRQTLPLVGAAGKDSLQVQIGVKDYGLIFCGGSNSPSGTFLLFDNFAIGKIGLVAPTLSASELDLYNDTFRTSAFYKDDNLNTARGDTLAVRVGASRGILSASFFYRLNGGSFSSLPLTKVGSAAPGVYYADVPAGSYPRGTVVEYYFSATDSLNDTSTLPADAVAQNRFFQATVLPATHPAAPFCAGDSANVLYVNGTDGLAGPTALDQSLAAVGLSYDRYDINAPGLGAGNSPGGADPNNADEKWPGAGASDLARYTAIVWDVGDRSSALLSAPDQQLLAAWLALTGRNRGLLLSGDNIAFDLSANQQDIGTFLSCTLGATYVRDVWESIPQDSLDPVLVGAAGTYAGGNVFPYAGGCPSINRFDGLSTSVCAGSKARMWVRYPVNMMAAVERRDALGAAGGDSTRSILLGAGLGAMAGAVPRNVFLWWSVVKEFEVPFCYVPTAVAVSGPDAPGARPVLHGAAPNPFNPATAIRFTLPHAAHARVRVFDVSGALVRTLADRDYPAGTHSLTWDGTDDRGRNLASGAYFYRLEADGTREARKLILLK